MSMTQDRSTESSQEALEKGAMVEGPRKLFFNIPLPVEALNEHGKPAARFGRNKIRTAKYTPLSFLPKNLFHQFNNIANIYFFFLIILGVSFICSAGTRNPTLMNFVDFQHLWGCES
jgi:phospholipid-translocating ATPase